MMTESTNDPNRILVEEPHLIDEALADGVAAVVEYEAQNSYSTHNDGIEGEVDSPIWPDVVYEQMEDSGESP